MGKIYSAPSSIPVPTFKFDSNNPNWREEQEAKEKKYLADLKALLIERKDGKNVGEIVRFPVADGYAEYMVASMRPLELIHLTLGDAWDYQHIHRLTAQDIQDNLDRAKAMADLFKNKG